MSGGPLQPDRPHPAARRPAELLRPTRGPLQRRRRRTSMRESVIQHGVAQAGFSAPPILMRGSSRSPLERPFMISPLVSGKTFDEVLRPTPRSVDVPPAARSSSAEIDERRSTPCRRLRSPNVSLPRAGPHRGSTASRCSPTLEEQSPRCVIAGAHDRRPRGSGLTSRCFAPPVVCHGDLHPLNLLFDGEAGGRRARLGARAPRRSRVRRRAHVDAAPGGALSDVASGANSRPPDGRAARQALRREVPDAARRRRGVTRAGTTRCTACARSRWRPLGAATSRPPIACDASPTCGFPSTPKLKKRFTEITSVPM